MPGVTFRPGILFPHSLQMELLELINCFNAFMDKLQDMIRAIKRTGFGIQNISC